MTSYKRFAAMTVMLLGLGCQPEAEPTTDVPTVDEEVQLTVASWDEVQQMVTQQKGKVVVVDLWSTWCLPCVREFPSLVKIRNTYQDEVQCMSVNLNYDGSPEEPPESHRETVMAFLTEQNATFQNVICSDPDLELYDRIDLGAIPAVYVYDKQGTLRKRFDNDREEYGDEGFSYEEHVTPLVEQLIAE